MTEAMDKLLERGILGLLLAISLGAIYYLFKLLQEERAARIADGKETQKLLIEFQKTIVEAIHKLGEVIEWAEKRADELTRSERRRP